MVNTADPWQERKMRLSMKAPGFGVGSNESRCSEGCNQDVFPKILSLQISYLSQCHSGSSHFSPDAAYISTLLHTDSQGLEGQLRASNRRAAGESVGLQQPLYSSETGKMLAMTNTFPNPWSLTNISVHASPFVYASGSLAWEVN